MKKLNSFYNALNVLQSQGVTSSQSYCPLPGGHPVQLVYPF